MERAAIAMPLAAERCKKFRFCFFGLGEGKFSGDVEVSVNFGIDLLDAREHEFAEFDGGELAFAEEFSDFLDGCAGKVGVVHGCHIKSPAKMPWLKPGTAQNPN